MSDDAYPYQLPRHLHKAGASQIVHTPAACEAALADGWEIHPSTPAELAVDVKVVEASEPAASEGGAPEIVAPTKKRKR